MKVCKFGGTSVGSVERMKNVANLISDDHPKIVVLSATAGTTDHLEKIVSYIFNREIDEAHNEITKLEFYFVDFANFSRHNLPVGWNDEIGGVFQVLDGRWYNSSRRYVRGHFTYEAPFLILKHLMKYTRYVQNERIYVSALAMPHLQPYLEVGYGIGTHIFDVGVFVSSENWKFGGIGCKFTFELFNR